MLSVFQEINKSLYLSYDPQKRYLSLGTSNSSASWWVPLNLLVPGAGGAGGRDQEPLQWLSDEEGVASEHRFRHAAKSNQWLLFNADMMGESC